MTHILKALVISLPFLGNATSRFLGFSLQIYLFPIKQTGPSSQFHQILRLLMPILIRLYQEHMED
jgi:hypothetical protein